MNQTHRHDDGNAIENEIVALVADAKRERTERIARSKVSTRLEEASFVSNFKADRLRGQVEGLLDDIAILREQATAEEEFDCDLRFVLDEYLECIQSRPRLMALIDHGYSPEYIDAVCRVMWQLSYLDVWGIDKVLAGKIKLDDLNRQCTLSDVMANISVQDGDSFESRRADILEIGRGTDTTWEVSQKDQANIDKGWAHMARLGRVSRVRLVALIERGFSAEYIKENRDYIFMGSIPHFSSNERWELADTDAYLIDKVVAGEMELSDIPHQFSLTEGRTL